MSFFEESDPFESVIREFFGGRPIQRQARSNQFIRGEEEDRSIDFVEDDEYVYVVFELPGYSEDDVTIQVKGKDLIIDAQKSKGDMQPYLKPKLQQGIHIAKTLPSFVNPKKHTYSFQNGILELVFLKEKNG